eukprot:gnl/Spiro4/28581_TR14134_c0_g1_i5.p1 gnl/Spiro4/28581_TR14134_c0_g1~~gnl/Spiro4/28581_TR14134_c0_g1_i5.p1  ORF type:complete len:185 (+),score=33.55 gnl/Spiro4/28581_TR14134_c0_g1_i5:314-868(+)
MGHWAKECPALLEKQKEQKRARPSRETTERLLFNLKLIRVQAEESLKQNAELKGKTPVWTAAGASASLPSPPDEAPPVCTQGAEISAETSTLPESTDTTPVETRKVHKKKKKTKLLSVGCVDVDGGLVSAVATKAKQKQKHKPKEKQPKKRPRTDPTPALDTPDLSSAQNAQDEQGGFSLLLDY